MSNVNRTRIVSTSEKTKGKKKKKKTLKSEIP